MKRASRLRELDFLRGVAILLVLLRHKFLFQFTSNMGWIGVDLFFVISGFLVSGLLFKEYLKFGQIRPGRFLIRRGFKIYPIFYLSYPLYILPMLLKGKFSALGILADLTFIQNYIWGLGYGYPASWSLAVEEHFYFVIAFLMWYGLKKNVLKLKVQQNCTRPGLIEIGIISVFLACTLLRIYNNLIFPELQSKNFSMTHLRIDSLLSGVLVSYLYYFRLEYLTKTFMAYRPWLLVIPFFGTIWAIFIDPMPSFFAKTIGFTLLYISFSISLLFFLLTPNINQKLNNIFSTLVVNLVSQIGFCSYSIYIIHTFVNLSLGKIQKIYHPFNNHFVDFALAAILSISIGMFMTYVVENYFLKIRDKYFPPFGNNNSSVYGQSKLLLN